ncbi:uncharacterized protein LOC113512367 [Galleria mellonella]|uniref:Uncharacterized protein LOC113512367 n=1 Tax=Galleria mellonella TaxID=7137 RepID=A0A6J1WLU5_GALME|nr:uncharacterized protein LOC113512367 [Galleria mellonella]
MFSNKLTNSYKQSPDATDMDVLSFLDLLDLDEEIVDARLHILMKKQSHTNKHLANVLQLLNYKNLINTQENSECSNSEEYAFVAKIINQIQNDNIDNICKIIRVALNLNTKTLVSKSEHLLQQILSMMDLSPEKLNEESASNQALLTFQLCDNILDLIISHGETICLPFYELPVENILFCNNDKLKVNFLTNTVPKFLQGVWGFNILDAIWTCLKNSAQQYNEFVLNILSCLSDYYLPAPDDRGILAYESQVVRQVEFWSIILFGLMSLNPTVRKISLYLNKRAIDCLKAMKKNIVVQFENDIILHWDPVKEFDCKNMWENYFTLFDSLEEKQSNIVLPSLQLFQSLGNIGAVWLNCLFHIGLKHDNIQVRVKCIHYKLDTPFSNQSEVVVLLEALNDINIYENPTEYGMIKEKIANLYHDLKFFILFYQSIPFVNWSPVPLYHVSNIITLICPTNIIKTSQEIDSALCNLSGEEIVQLIRYLLNIPCNIVTLRKAIHVNMAYFLKICCSKLKWNHLLGVFSLFQIDFFEYKFIIEFVKQHILSRIDNKTFFLESLMKSVSDIDFMIFYLECESDDLLIFDELLHKKLKNIQDVINRQYSNKREFLDDVIFIIHLYNRTLNKELFRARIERDQKFILSYIFTLLSCETTLTIEEITPFLNEYLSSVKTDSDNKDIFVQLYIISIMLIKDRNTDLAKAVLCMHIINKLHKNFSLKSESRQLMISLYDILNLIMSFENTQNIGRLTNVFYENSCELLYYMIKSNDEDIVKHTKDIIVYIEKVIECGGYGCLIWLLRIINLILPTIMGKEENFNVMVFLNRMWKEIEELKSNNQYSPCIEEFINLLMQDSLLNQPMYNNIIILYCNKIIEYGPTKNFPLFCLIKKLNTKEIIYKYGHLIYVLTEILLYTPVPRKDQRIVENLVVEILQDPTYEIYQSHDVITNLQIQCSAVMTLSKIDYLEILSTITSLIIKKIDEIFKNTQRYHAGSKPHRAVFMALQHFLAVFLKTGGEDTRVIKNWCLDFLSKLPHQPNVRICLEWYIALCCYVQKTKVNKEFLQELIDKNVPLTSQLVILYWVFKRKFLNGTSTKPEYNFVMDTLLSNTMGQMFNIRLHAQYMSTKLHTMNESNSKKYAYTIDIINRTLDENSNDKNLIKMKNDYFINQFDIMADLTFPFIYNYLPKYTDIKQEIVNINYINDIMKSLNEIDVMTDSTFHKEWKSCHRPDEQDAHLLCSKYSFNNTSEAEPAEPELTGTIQKKYIPWKNMSDVNVYEIKKKRESPSDLIVIASLIDKLPNLGGMARTSEVFGVKTYVVDSLRHLQDKQFQNLSVSAERWIDVEEVRPGIALKQYLMRKRSEGYAVVAAEQTSNSFQLQTFKFPKKTLLLLGHEKEGIPCDLLPLMDYCVEIPQQGVIRSLNVHVTAAIFVWEYARQNIL